MSYPKYVPADAFHRKAYYAFAGMHIRCYNVRCADYKYYGARGIKIDGIWNLSNKMGFNAFVADVGLPPTLAHTLDRIDVDGNYNKQNCRWATHSEQMSNRRRWMPVVSHVIAAKPDGYFEVWKHIHIAGAHQAYVCRTKTWQEAHELCKELDKKWAAII